MYQGYVLTKVKLIITYYILKRKFGGIYSNEHKMPNEGYKIDID